MRKNRSVVMTDKPRRGALASRRFVLDAEHFDAFAQILAKPPALGPKLRELLRRIPAWPK